MGHLPSHFSQSLPTAIPGCLRHMIRSGWCFAIVRPQNEGYDAAEGPKRRAADMQKPTSHGDWGDRGPPHAVQRERCVGVKKDYV